VKAARHQVEDPIPFHLRVGAVLSGLGYTAFTANAQRLHKAFHRLTREHPELFPGFAFEELSTYPYSRELRSAIFRLQQSGAVSADNPSWVRYEVHKEELAAKLEDVGQDAPDVIRALVTLGKEIAGELQLTDEEQTAASVDKTLT
jgi:hypothetical protein